MEQARAGNVEDIASNMSHLQNPSFANRLQATDSMSNLSKFQSMASMGSGRNAFQKRAMSIDPGAMQNTFYKGFIAE